MKLAIVADWLPTYGGAEHVIAAMHDLWPEAPVFTTVAKPSHLGPLQKADIRTDPLLQTIYRFTGRHQYLLPLMPRAIERIDCSGYDTVLSSSHAVGKGIIPPPTSVHVCYCHTPMRYAWEMEEEYLADFRIRGWLKKYVKAELKRLRRWDIATAKRVDRFIANSTETQKRIQRIYGRESVVIPPPVDDRFFSVPLRRTQTSSYYLALGRLVPYKRFDLLIDLANSLSLPLKIGGTGGDMDRLKKLAGPTIQFIGFVPEENVPALFAGAECLLFPQVEDAGIVPLEAQACGVPVIAFGKGGVLDVVIDGQTGIFAKTQTVEGFREALQRARRDWDRTGIRRHAEKFRTESFKEKIRSEIELARQKFVPQEE